MPNDNNHGTKILKFSVISKTRTFSELDYT